MNVTTDVTNNDTKDRTIRIPLTKSSGSCFGGTSSAYAIDRTLLFQNEVPTATWDGDGSPGAEWNRFCDLVNSHLRPINRLRLVVSVSAAAAVVSLCIGLVIAYRGDLAHMATSSSSSSHTMTNALISFLGLGLAFVATAIAVSCRIAGVTKRSFLAIKELCRGRSFHQSPGQPLLSVHLCDDDRVTTTISPRSSRRSYTGEGYHPRGIGICHNVYLLLTTTTSSSTHDDDATDLELGFECVASSAKSPSPPPPPAFFFTTLPNQKKGGAGRRGDDNDDGTRSMTDDSSTSSSSSSSLSYVDNMTLEGDIVLEMMDRIQLYEQRPVNSSNSRDDDEFSLTDDDDLETVAMEDVYRQSVVAEVVSKTSDGAAATSTRKKKKTNKKRKVKDGASGTATKQSSRSHQKEKENGTKEKKKKTKARDTRKEAKETKTKNKTISKTKTTALSQLATSGRP